MLKQRGQQSLPVIKVCYFGALWLARNFNLCSQSMSTTCIEAYIPLFDSNFESLLKAKYTIPLSGTPALSRPIELFKQLEALYPDVYKNVHEYGKRYCQGVSYYFLSDEVFFIQAEDRAHRIGQVSSVNVYYLLANDTVDDII